MHRLRTRTLLICAVLLILGRATPAWAVTMTLAWDASSDLTIAGYQLSYGTSPGNYTSTLDVGNVTVASVSGLAAGQRYYFVVRAYNAAGLSNPSSEVSGDAVALVALLSTASSSVIPTGAPVTWTALPLSGASLEYQFWRQYVPTGTWNIVQSYGPQNSFTWTPTPAELGTYVIQVWARVPGSPDPLDAWKATHPFTVANTPVIVGSVEADVALPAPTGSPITWKAKAMGGPAPLQYRFYRQNLATGAWTLARDYSVDDSFAWTPTAGDLGSHRIQVWVRGAGSAAAFDGWRNSEAFAVTNGPPAVASLTANVAFPAGAGTPITWTAVASGGPGPLQYKFYRWSAATSLWTLAQDYGPSDSYMWTPGAADQGTYVIQVWVRRTGSSTSFEAWAGTPQFQIANSAPAIQIISANAGAPMGTGLPITWRVDATGGPGPFEYQFWLYNVDRDAWSLARTYSTSRTFTWTPGEWDAGSYMVQAWVRRPGSSNAFDAWRSTSVFAVGNTAPTIAAITNNVGTAGTVGMPITWTANPAGGQGALEYKFFRYNSSTQAWTVVQDYSWDMTFGWVPLPGEQGTYSFQVWVRRAGSAAAFEGWAASGNFTVN